MSYEAEKFEEAALAGDEMAASTLLSRASLKPEVREALLARATREIRLGFMSRSDVTEDELKIIAETSDTYVLNRIVAHGKTPTSIIREIRERSEGREELTWSALHAFATRVLDRLANESGLHRGS